MNKFLLDSKQTVFLVSGVTTLFLLSPIYESFAQGYGQGKSNIERGEEYNHGKGQNKELNEFSNSFDTTQPISSFEKEALEKMGEEEFLARDVYLALYEKWDLQIFSNISKSEQKHADKIIELTNAYGLSNFSNHEAGVFEDSELQSLYNNLIEKGLTSEGEALKVGATIEDLDIYDLELFLENIQNKDIRKVFENLNRGSRNHMRAFISQLEKRNSAYQPVYITEERFLDIINGEHEKGNSSNKKLNNEKGKSNIERGQGKKGDFRGQKNAQNNDEVNKGKGNGKQKNKLNEKNTRNKYSIEERKFINWFNSLFF